jgi:hypothetical protein
MCRAAGARAFYEPSTHRFRGGLRYNAAPPLANPNDDLVQE